MKGKKPSLSLDQAWTEVLATIGKDAERIGKQLNAAEKQFPQLARSFKLLLAYQGFLARQNELAAASAQLFRRPNGLPSVGYTPWPPFPPLPPPPLPEELCRFVPTLCKCSDGDMDACLDLAGDEEEPREPFERVSPCNEICAAYKVALQCALQYCDQMNNLTRTQYREWVRCQRDIDDYWNQLLERGCINIQEYFVAVQELPALRFSG